MTDTTASFRDEQLLDCTTRIVTVSIGRAAEPLDIPALIASVHRALAGLGQSVAIKPARPEPAVSIRASVKPDHIICLEDGRKLKMLKRHLKTAYNLTPDEYRARWGLPTDYPMVAPEYAAKRRQLALSIRLGHSRVPA